MRYVIQALRQATQTSRKKLSRRVLHLRMRNAPQAEHLAAERRLRGKEQLEKLKRADIVVVSFGKSGRTWLRVMLSHLFRVKHKLPKNAILGFDNFHNLAGDVPKIFFTHDNYIKDFTGEDDNKKPFYGKKVVLMARDPRDVAVSQFFQWKFRMKPNKMLINDYPPPGTEVELFDFVVGENGGGMPKIIEYLNLWARESAHIDEFYLVRYEDLRREPEGELRKLLDFMAVDADDSTIKAAVEYSAYENMKKMEGEKRFRLAGGRMMPKDKNNPDSYKVRRAKVGGYRDYFDDGQIKIIDDTVNNTLNAIYRYHFQ